VPIIPVLQGWDLADYERCIELYERAGIDLSAESVVGLGSICRRQHTDAIGQLVDNLANQFRLHGFGVKQKGLAKYADALASADSLAWSFNARRNPQNRLPECQHRSCQNCLPYALRWRERTLAAMT
jgi:hypothetical protein